MGKPHTMDAVARAAGRAVDRSRWHDAGSRLAVDGGQRLVCERADVVREAHVGRTTCKECGMSTDWYSDVLAFHRKFGCVIGGKPAVPSEGTVALRLDLVSEEFWELLDSISEDN